jgi:hypothetical protein
MRTRVPSELLITMYQSGRRHILENQHIFTISSHLPHPTVKKHVKLNWQHCNVSYLGNNSVFIYMRTQLKANVETEETSF